MATYKGDNEYQGSIGNLVFYTLNGKPVVRARRSKMSKSEKKNLDPAIGRQNNRFATVSTFCRMLRTGIPEKFACDKNRHSRLVSHVSTEILQRDSISPPDDFKIRKEHLHHLNGVVLNSEFPPEILNTLNASKLEWNGENFEVHLPVLPLNKLKKKPEAYRLWVQLKILSLDKPYAVSYVRFKESDPIDFNENGGMSFSFDMPKAGENEGVFAALGFNSLKGGKMIEDVGGNGFVVISGIENL